jgi:hypothetical protein
VRDGTRLGLLALAGAALLGLLGDLLLRALPWGLNAPVWLLALVMVAGLLSWQAKLPLLSGARWLAIPALLFAAGIAWRDSQVLLTVNVLAVLLTLGLAAHRAPGGWPRVGGLPQYLGALISAGFHACGGTLVLAFYDIHWKEVPRTGWSAVVLAVLRGLLIAIPLLLVFGGLLMAADAVFSGLIRNALAIDAKELFGHAFWLLVWAWLTAGFLRQLLFCTIAIDGAGGTAQALAASIDGAAPVAADSLRTGERPLLGDLPATEADVKGEANADDDVPTETAPDASAEPPAGGTPGTPAPSPARPRRPGGRVGFLGIVELGVVLGLLDILFLAFVIVQFRYLFGGADLVLVSPTLTYAEYARRGFFELVWVAALLLSIMLFLDWLARLDRPREVVIYRMLAGLLVALLFVVIVSALQRMRLYTQEYGLTELRLYTTAFMLWITAGAVWFLATVLRDHRERFLFGALVAGLVVAGGLDVLNPDDLIVRTNAARHDAPARFDAVYTLNLSADATPALIDALPSMPENQRASVANRLLTRWESAQAQDWRSWSYGRWQAFRTTADHEEALRALVPPPPSPGSTVRPGGGRGTGGSRLDIDIPEPDKHP